MSDMRMWASIHFSDLAAHETLLTHPLKLAVDFLVKKEKDYNNNSTHDSRKTMVLPRASV